MLDTYELVSLLSYAGLDRVTLKKDEIWFCCPYHSDKTPSASINTYKKTFYCFSCGNGSTLYKFLKYLNVHDILTDVKSKFVPISKNIEVTHKNIPNSIDELEHTIQNRGNLEEGKILFTESEAISMNEKANKYLIGRLGKDYKLPIEARYNKTKNTIMFKTRYNFVSRNIDNKEYLTYGKTLNLFCSFEKIGGPLIIVEGVFDGLTCYNFGFKNFASILNAVITPVQISNLSDLMFSEIVLCPDNDKAGLRNLAKNTKALLMATEMPISLMIIKGKKDANSLSFDEFTKFYHNRRYIRELKKQKINGIEF